MGPWHNKNPERFIEKIKLERPDVTLLYQGHYFDNDTLEQVRPYTFLTGYHNDDPFGSRKTLLRYRLLLHFCSHYHGFHVYRDCNVSEALAYGIPRVAVLKPYYLPWLDYPRDFGQADRKRWGCDVAFAGHVENDLRVECMTKAASNGIKLRLYGEELHWKKALPPGVYDSIKPILHVTGDDYRKALCGAKIAASFFSKWNRDKYTRRSFEIPACRVFMLSERTEVMQEMFEEGKEAEYFSSVEEFMDKLKFYLRNEDKRERIAEDGFHRVTTSGQDIYSRMKQWLHDVSVWRMETNNCCN